MYVLKLRLCVAWSKREKERKRKINVTFSSMILIDKLKGDKSIDSDILAAIFS